MRLFIGIKSGTNYKLKTMSFEKEHVLLDKVGEVVRENQEIEMKKGEGFNIFSILKLETSENKTHSAFIAELLNPKGTHQKKGLFLSLFANLIGIKEWPDFDRTTVIIEKHIGKTDLEAASGGRVDIYITYGNQSICIENKIYAGDQPKQIQRYCKHNKFNNKVYYLTLKGGMPHVDSCGDLVADIDYYCISYKHTIIEWLQLCLEHTDEHPILRETIRQYIILIKKLTGTLTNKKMENELMDLLFNNLEAADTISQNLRTAKYKVKSAFRKEVQQLLQEAVGNDFRVQLGAADVDKNYSQLWIIPVTDKTTQLKYGIESFSGKGHFNGNMFYGIQSAKVKKDELPAGLKTERTFGTWLQYREYEAYDQKIMNINHKFLLAELHRNETFRTGLKNHIVENFMVYFNETKVELLGFIEKEKRNIMALEEKNS